MINLSDKKVAIYGGTFNPIHIGHLLTGFDVIEKLKYDYIIYIPTNISVHKNTNNALSAKHRLKMVDLSIKGIKGFLSSDVEIRRGGLTYTIDTIRQLKEEYKYNGKFGIVFGDDLIEDLSTWKEIELLQDIADLICLFRNNRNIIHSKYKVRWVKNRVVEINSTEIRERINKNISINFMVTNDVNKYILTKKLYRN
ncbi:MAG: nicotinate-nucleotide adenylyltransferase [Spirochaetes bacterium]|nr:nicotinate-nucleotide adenylyltransferase [Spirochaetota bacterium]